MLLVLCCTTTFIYSITILPTVNIVHVLYMCIHHQTQSTRVCCCCCCFLTLTLVNSRLQTTAVGLPAPYEPHGNREHRRTRLLSGVLSEWRPASMQWNKSNRTKSHLYKYQWSPRLPGLSDRLQRSYDASAWKFKFAGGRSPWRVYNSSTNSTKTSDVKGIQLFYKLYKNQWRKQRVVLLPRKNNPKKEDDRCSHDDVRAGRGSPRATLLLWFSVAASSP